MTDAQPPTDSSARRRLPPGARSRPCARGRSPASTGSCTSPGSRSSSRFVVWFNFAPFANTIGDPARPVRRRADHARPVQRGAHRPGAHLHRHGARPLRPPPDVRGDPDVRRDPVHDLRPVQFVQHARAQPARSVGGRRRVRGRHPHGVGVVPAERGRHRRGRLRRLGQLRRRGRRVLAPAVRRSFATLLGGDDGWRWAILLTGVIAAGLRRLLPPAVTDTPEGVTYVRPRRQGALEVTNRKAVFGLAAMTVPVNAALGLIAWRIWRVDVISTPLFVAVLVAVAVAARRPGASPCSR